MRVFINPGHAPNGNPDPGAVNPRTGARECDFALSAGQLLEGYLNNVGIETKVFQCDDLADICAESNNFGADIFVSLHCNAFDGSVRGTETLYRSMAGQRLASCIQSQIIRSIATHDRGTKKRDGLYVLNGTDAVAVLVEMAFIDNDDDLEMLENDLDTIVRAIARGITDYEQLPG